MFEKEKVFPFSKEGLEKSKRGRLNKVIKDMEGWLSKAENFRKVVVITGLVFQAFEGHIVYAATNWDDKTWIAIRLAQKGLRTVSLLIFFYGLYLQLLKKEDTGKKVSWGAVIVYVCGLLGPVIFNSIDEIFGVK